jgi:predicted nucleic acid-binding Zn finger protein
MEASKEIKILMNICEEAKQEGKLSSQQIAHLKKVFSTRFQKAWKALKEKRVKKYSFSPSGRIIWIVVGRKRDYIVMPAADFCSCDDFYYNIMERKAHFCYHLIAQKISEALGWYDIINDNDNFYNVLMEEWKKFTY